MQQLKVVQQFMNRHIWEIDTRALSRWRASLVGALRITYLVLRDLFFDTQLTMQAMSLVYTTLLALVPLLAVSVSVLKGFGVHNQIEPMLLNFLEPLGERGVDITRNITHFVKNIHSGLLGSVGLALLLYTVISLMQKIEQAFNHAWRVSENRSFAQRFSDYLSVILIGPVLIFVAMGLTASVTNSSVYQKFVEIPAFGFLVGTLSQILPFFLVIMAFTMIYIFLPNTRVKFTSALVGASVAGVLWQTTGLLFGLFVSNANYSLIYSAFAAMFLFMIWLYVSWTILLIGASIAFYFQHPAQRVREQRLRQLSNRMKERLALASMAEIGRRFYRQQGSCNLHDLATRMGITEELLQPLVTALQLRGLLVRTDADTHGYVPGQPPETMSLLSIVDAVRQAEENESLSLQLLTADPLVDQYFTRYQEAAAATLATATLKDLVDRESLVVRNE